MVIGVLALQGDVIEHIRTLEKCGVKAKEVCTRDDIFAIDGLIIPGGESTTISKLLKRFSLDTALCERAKNAFPIYGTCAGAILLSKKAGNREPQILRLMDIDVERNAYGRQLDSFEATLQAPDISDRPIAGVFIRAPKITRVGKKVKILARYPEKNGDIVLCREKNFLASTFHPELTSDSSIHEYFIEMVRSA